MLIVEAGAIPLLVELLRDDSSEWGWSAAMKSLADLASSDDDAFKAAIVEAGAILPLVELLRDSSDRVGGADRALVALADLVAGEDDLVKLAMLDAGAIPLLVERLHSGTAEDTRANAAGVLMCLTAGDTYAGHFEIK